MKENLLEEKKETLKQFDDFLNSLQKFSDLSFIHRKTQRRSRAFFRLDIY